MLQEQIEDLLSQIDEHLRVERKKTHVNLTGLEGDLLLRESAGDVRGLVQDHLDGRYPEYDSEVWVDGHRRLEIRMRLRPA